MTSAVVGTLQHKILVVIALVSNKCADAPELLLHAYRKKVDISTVVPTKCDSDVINILFTSVK